MTSIRLTREEARAIDRAALEEYGIPTLVLMEHAGRSAAELVRDVADARTVTVVAGGGNNGGDGFVIARFLGAFGVDVECLCCAPLDATHGDARIERDVALRSGVRLLDASTRAEWDVQRARLLRASGPRVFVDALLGTGFEGALKPLAAHAIATVNELRAALGAQTVAIDLPSGLDCDTGVLADPTIQADVTATFVAEKRGFDTAAARAVLGRVVVLPIGLPRGVLERVLGRRGTQSSRRDSQS